MLFAFVTYYEDERNGLKSKVDDVADAESDDEGAGLGDVGERPCAEDDKVEEEGADSESKKVFDEGAGVFVKTFYNSIVLYARDDSEVEGNGWQDGLEEFWGKPEGAEGCQHEKDGDGNEGYVVFLHG